jgi:hypothetical protein
MKLSIALLTSALALAAATSQPDATTLLSAKATAAASQNITINEADSGHRGGGAVGHVGGGNGRSALTDESTLLGLIMLVSAALM